MSKRSLTCSAQKFAIYRWSQTSGAYPDLSARIRSSSVLPANLAYNLRLADIMHGVSPFLTPKGFMMRKVIGKMVLACLLATGSLVAQEDDGAKQEATNNPVEQIQTLIQQGKLDEAKKLFDSTELEKREEATIMRDLMNGFVRKGNVEAAYDLAKSDFLKSLEGSEGLALASLSMATMYAPRAQKSDDAAELAQMAMEYLNKQPKEEGYSPLLAQEFAVAGIQSRFLASAGDREKAKELNDQYLNRAKQLVEEQPESPEVLSLFVSTTMNSMQTVDAEQTEFLFTEARDLLLDRMTKTDYEREVVGQYAALKYRYISSMYRDNPNLAETLLNETKEKLAAAVEVDKANETIAEQYLRMLSSIESRIASAKKLAELVGSPAPAIDAKYWVNGKDISVDNLDDKVVLLDFWAVWCGPCIATFPHLQEWNEEFGPKGLQIVGVTRKYNYQWNDEANRASRADGEVTDVEELAMLEKFLAHHELQHPTIITPENSTMQQDYAVSGIPHAVLIDRKGVVRMIKVGSGEANANAIHDMIVELLAE